MIGIEMKGFFNIGGIINITLIERIPRSSASG